MQFFVQYRLSSLTNPSSHASFASTTPSPHPETPIVVSGAAPLVPVASPVLLVVVDSSSTGAVVGVSGVVVGVPGVVEAPVVPESAPMTGIAVSVQARPGRLQRKTRMRQRKTR